ncbi:MAG: hypothetical protein ACOX1O_07240 [Eggerthellaceae bacterium]|jgi:hypothetical protein
MTYQAYYESAGNTALKADGSLCREPADRIIPFPGNPRNAWGTPSEKQAQLRRECRVQESVTVESVPFGVEYIEARHLFYWMTDEMSANLRAHHAPKMSPLQRKAYYLADRIRNAVENHPFTRQLRYGTIAGDREDQVTTAQAAKVLVVGTVVALLVTLL